MYNWQIGSTYSFNSLAPAVLGAAFTNVQLLSIMNYQTATQFSNVAQQAQVIYPLLPQGTPSDPTSYVYLLFKTSTNTNIVLAYTWIDPNSIVVAGGITITVTVNNASNADVTTIRDQLTLLGYTSFNITTS